LSFGFDHWGLELIGLLACLREAAPAKAGVWDMEIRFLWKKLQFDYIPR